MFQPFARPLLAGLVLALAANVAVAQGAVQNTSRMKRLLLNEVVPFQDESGVGKIVAYRFGQSFKHCARTRSK